MATNANSVNIRKRGYHHGDLRTALITAGIRLLAERDAESLSLREVARVVGVSATSVYRHFPDKGALMAELAREGLARLSASQHKAYAAAGGAKAGFMAIGRAYVRFALANPALFRLIFASSALGRSGDSPQVSEALALLYANAPTGSRANVPSAESKLRSLKALAFAHGLAMLMLDGQIPSTDSLIDRMIT